MKLSGAAVRAAAAATSGFISLELSLINHSPHLLERKEIIRLGPSDDLSCYCLILFGVHSPLTSKCACF